MIKACTNLVMLRNRGTGLLRPNGHGCLCQFPVCPIARHSRAIMAFANSLGSLYRLFSTTLASDRYDEFPSEGCEKLHPAKKAADTAWPEGVKHRTTIDAVSLPNNQSLALRDAKAYWKWIPCHFQSRVHTYLRGSLRRQCSLADTQQ